MKITAIQIIEDSYGEDILLLTTDLPDPSYPFVGNCIVKLFAAKGTGEAYAKKHFGDKVPMTIIQAWKIS